MTWTYDVQLGLYTGLSTVAKPTNVDRDTVAYEYDTGNLYIFDGTIWRAWGGTL